MVETVAAKAPSLSKNALLKFSLRGQSKMLEDMAVAQKPLLGSFCLTGQSTILAAPPNAGKTLITLAALIEAIEEGRIQGDNVIYVDADDDTQGVASKVALLDEYGVHVVAEGFLGFKAGLLIGALDEMIENGTARGKFLILDTFKKFTQPMSKAESSAFLHVSRRFVLAGGTMLSLAHTNKHKDSKGNNVFAGVSDIMDDTDCAYIVDVKDDQDGKRIVQFTNKKRRGNNPDTIVYAYAPDPELTYLQRLTSVHVTDAYVNGGDDVLDHKTSDIDILQSIWLTIYHSPERGKMKLVRSVAKQHIVSKQRVLKLLEANTGDDPEKYLWRATVKAHGLHDFEVLGPMPDAPPAASSRIQVSVSSVSAGAVHGVGDGSTPRRPAPKLPKSKYD